MTVEELSERVSAREYERWIALYEVEAEEHRRAMRRAKDGKGAE